MSGSSNKTTKLSNRQWQLQLKELAKDQYAKLLDYFTCVERMYWWSWHQLQKSMKKGVGNQWFITIKGPNNHDDMKVDVEELLVGLPLHLLACLMTGQPCEGSALTDCNLSMQDNIDYLYRGFQLLYNLLFITLRFTRLLTLISDKERNPKFVESVVDLSLMSQTSVLGPLQEECMDSVINTVFYDNRGGVKNSNCSCFAAMVSYSVGMMLIASKIQLGEAIDEEDEEMGLQLVNEQIVYVLLAHPQAKLLMRVLFDSVGIVFEMIRLGIQNGTKIDEIHNLCYSAGASMEYITQLVDNSAFYYYMMLTEESPVAPLRLIRAGFQLVQPPLYIPHVHHVQNAKDMVSSRQFSGDIEFLGARCFLLLNSLLPTHYSRKISFYTQVCKDVTAMSILTEICQQANELSGNVLLRPPINASTGTSMGQGERQLFMHALRCTETLIKLNVEDSFQYMLPIINNLLNWDTHAFQSRWVGGQESVLMHFVYDFAIVSSQPEVELLWEGIWETGPLVISVPNLPKLRDAEGNEVDEHEILQNALGSALEMAIRLNNIVNIMIRQVEIKENTQSNWNALQNLLKKIPPSDKLSVCSPME